MKIFLDTNIFPEFIDRRVTTGSGHFVTVTKYPDPDVTLIIMAKRIITKIGDIFCVEVDNDYKCYFQYVANDMTVLNSSVIRVFARHYSIDYEPVFEDIVKDEVYFYAHTILRFGILYNAWYNRKS